MNRKFITGLSKRKRFRGDSDEDLLQQYVTNKSAGIIDELFERYVHLVYGLCMNYLKDEEQAKDTTMIIFESLEDKLNKFEVKYFKSWLYTVARNACLMELRKKKYEKPVDQVEIFLLRSVENDEELHLMNEDNRLEEDLVIYLHKLNNNQRKCLDMMYFQKKSYKEIAAETGFSLKEVKSHIQNGKRNLRNLLSSRNE